MLRTLAGSAMLLAGLLGAGGLPLTAQDPKTPPSVQDIMREANKPTGLFFELQRTLKDAAPDWADAVDSARELTALATSLTKHQATRGAAASWEKLTGDYLAQTKALEQAVVRKDRAGAQAAVARIAPALCTTCHQAHR